MNYQEQLNPWVIHQLLPDLQHSTVARFRKRHDAESYLKVMQQIRPRGQFAIAFDANSELQDSLAEY
ncbi:hypothetical protein IQ268_28990 [Oculatella sp. LEGE 06141]|uniref:hypothetical protein n=1 Tax=Oculatella sp. LEGE 06141 TaxID=1828648 RepID=UPI00187DEE39|nr:hypothetical protein [Oculatella sp. LEGE 06141]MBE9182589.1 hypothetical protein [Oculatella sp. LEGE 06141]